MPVKRLGLALMVLAVLPASAQGMTRSERCHKHSRVVLASVFTDSLGYHGDRLYSGQSYAELHMGSALGGLGYKHRLDIWRPGSKRVVRAYKRDIGLGGPANPLIDLHAVVARRLGLSPYTFLGTVRISSNRCY